MTRLKEIDFIRAISIIAVVMIHISTGNIMVNLPEQTLKVPISTFFIYHQMAYFSVSAFIVCSGIVLCMRYKNREFNYLKFVGSRSVILLVPYFVWSVIYLWWNGKLLKVSLSEFLSILANGAANSGLYFIPLLFLLCLLFPIFKFAVQRLKSPWWLVLFMFLQHYLHIRLQPFISSDFMILFQLRSYLFLFLAGCYIGQYYEEVKIFIDKYISAIVGLLGMILFYKICAFYYISQVLRVTITKIPLSATFDNRIYTLLIVALIIYVAPSIKNKYAEFALSRLGANSFGIYLAHFIFLKMEYNLTQKYNLTNIGSEGALMVLFIVIFVCYLLSEYINKIPYGYLFIGRNDKSVGTLKAPKLSDIISVEIVKK